MEQKDKQSKSYGVTFSYAGGRVLIHKATLEALGTPEYYRFLLAQNRKHFAIEPCGMDDEGAHRFRGFSENVKQSYRQSSHALIETIYNLCMWDPIKTFTVNGVVLFEGALIDFDLCEAVETKYNECLSPFVTR